MCPYHEGLITALMRIRQSEIRRERERVHRAWAGPPAPGGQLHSRLRRGVWPRCVHAGQEERWSA